jgi:hypothetical protein
MSGSSALGAVKAIMLLKQMRLEGIHVLLPAKLEREK